MKNPNGWGSITKLSGNRRKPWRVRKTKGWEWVSKTETEWIDKQSKQVIEDPTPKQIALKQVKKRKKIINNPTAEQLLNKEVKERRIYLELGCYATKQEAMTVLSDYNKDPYDPYLNSMTFAEIYNAWSEVHFRKIKNPNGYVSAFRTCEPIHNKIFTDLKLSHYQTLVDTCGKNTPTLKVLKNMLGLIYDYAVVNEIISADKRDMIRYIDINKAGNPNSLERKPFTTSDIQTLWESEPNNEYISVILIMIYSGVRISELLNLKKENVNLNEKWFDIVKAKTKAGIRKVPIAEKVLPFFQYWMNKNDCEYLLSNPEGKKFKYRSYYDSYWKPIIKALNMNYTPHCTRHTCVSLLAEAGVDKRMIQKIVGHKGQGVTDIVYTHFEINSLLEAINRI